MGLFDTVHFQCPSCGNDIEEQSKAGECLLLDYGNTEVPAEIAKSIYGNVVACRTCNHSYTIYCEMIPPPPTIKMFLK